MRYRLQIFAIEGHVLSETTSNDLEWLVEVEAAARKFEGDWYKFVYQDWDYITGRWRSRPRPPESSLDEVN